jgi:hypothetical protein
MNISVYNCHFSRGFGTHELGERETASLVFCGNSIGETAPVSGGGWIVKSWNNEVR